ncbi:hotdog fold thioesterase [Myroides sp. LJL119]
MIWNKPIDLEQLNNTPEYMGSFLDIVFTEFTPNTLTATMPVVEKTRQPWGILHGGASVVLAETIGSYASSLVIDLQKYTPVGLEINANHLRPVTRGLVQGVCSPIHLGRKTHVWDIKIHDENQKLVCISRLTVAILEKEK